MIESEKSPFKISTIDLPFIAKPWHLTCPNGLALSVIKAYSLLLFHSFLVMLVDALQEWSLTTYSTDSVDSMFGIVA